MNHKRTRIWAIVLAVALVLTTLTVTALADSETLYVATTGSDETGNGTQASPYATIQKAINQAPEGSTIKVGKGEYNVFVDASSDLNKAEDAGLSNSAVEHNLLVWKGVTIEAADPANKPILNTAHAGNGSGSSQQTVLITSSNVTLKNLVINVTTNNPNKAVEVMDWDESDEKNVTNTRIESCQINGADGTALYIGSKGVGTYYIIGNELTGSLVITNGAGNAMKENEVATVTGNTINGYVMITGTRNTAWNLYSIENLPEMKNNIIKGEKYTVDDVVHNMIVLYSDKDTNKLPTEADISNFISDNEPGSGWSCISFTNGKDSDSVNTSPYYTNCVGVVCDPVSLMHGENTTTYANLSDAIDAAVSGDTIVLAAGEYTLPTSGANHDCQILKAVNFIGSGKDETTLIGSINMEFCSKCIEDTDVQTEGVTFTALTMKSAGVHFALNFPGGNASCESSHGSRELNNVTFHIRDCAFEGYQYTIGVNGNAKNCVLDLNNTDFSDNFCAASVQTDNQNTVTVTDVTVTGGYALQQFGVEYNNLYETFDASDAPVGGSDVTYVNPAPSATEVEAGTTLKSAIETASEDTTIVLSGGTYNVGTLTIDKSINIIGAGPEKTTIVGSISFTGPATSTFGMDTVGQDINIKELKLIPSEDDQQGIWFSGYPNVFSENKILIDNCVLDGWQYGVTMNCGAKNNVVTIQNTEFKNTWCALSFDMSAANNNQLVVGDNVTTTPNALAVQVFGDSKDYHYYTLEAYQKACAAASNSATGMDRFNNKGLAEGVDYEDQDAHGYGKLKGYVVSNTAELKEAISRIGADQDGIIVLNAGTYEMPELTFNGRNDITLQGAGMGKTILKDTDNGYLINLSAGDCSNLKFKDMTLQSSDTTSVLVKVADGTNCSGLSFDNVAFNGATYGIYLSNDNKSQTSADDIQITDCVFTGMTHSGIYAQRGNIAVDGTVFKDITSADGTAAGILFDTGYFEENAYSLSVIDCEFSNITGTKSETKATGAISITGKGTVKELVVTDNTFADNTYDLHIGKTDGTPEIKDRVINSNGDMNVFIPDADAEYYVATFVSDKKVIDTMISDADGKVLMPKISKKGYTFLGWKSSADREVYKAGAVVKIEEDTTFTAQWVNNWGVVGGIVGGVGEGESFFTDVSGSAWYYDAVKFVFDNGFMDGVGDNKFNPNGTLTRAMIAQVLYNLEGETGSYPTVFDDVAKGAWYADAVNWAAASGIVEGKGNNKFDPNAAITRQEMAAILYRYSELKGYDVSKVDSLSGYQDASKVASWAKEAMGWAVENYVINGKGNSTLDPTGTATRAEVAQILMNYCNNVL